MYSTWNGKKRYGIQTVILTAIDREKNPVHGRKLCTPCTANFQYTKMEKPALKTVNMPILEL